MGVGRHRCGRHRQLHAARRLARRAGALCARRAAGQYCGGEGFDWYYASDADRLAGTRTPITDGAYGEPWVWRFKDLASWWSQPHHNRPGGVRDAGATGWCRRASRSGSPSSAAARSIAAPTSPMCLSIPRAPRALRPISRTGRRMCCSSGRCCGPASITGRQRHGRADLPLDLGCAALSGVPGPARCMERRDQSCDGPLADRPAGRHGERRAAAGGGGGFRRDAGCGRGRAALRPWLCGRGADERAAGVGAAAGSIGTDGARRNRRAVDRTGRWHGCAGDRRSRRGGGAAAGRGGGPIRARRWGGWR